MSLDTQFFSHEHQRGELVWFIGALAEIKAGQADTADALAAVEFTMPPGFATPQHVHHREDEAFYVLDGRIAGYCGDDEWVATVGAFIWLPREVPHGFKVDGDDNARILQLSLPSGFDQFVREAGTPATSARIPDPGPPDIERLDAAAQRTGQTILGPPRE
jgi:quercetin dioxygenase-like cupin family protein